ncbi:MAG: Rqc2 family fibronectin-binding protein [Myxococcales bacterium]|jgi:predicted ribosome quality control (RQC) complex YloA/Tae2 family protein
MSLTSREIALVVDELQPLVGAFVQKVYVPEPRVVLLDLRQPGESHLLLVCAETSRTRLHVASARPPSPQTPFAFQGLLRAELTGKALERIEAFEGERAVRLGFRGKTGASTLVAELTGRHGNLFLLDESQTVRGSAVPNLSELRDNRPGKVYVPPFARENPPDEDREARFEARAGEPFAISRAIEAHYSQRERTELVAERRRALVRTLRARRQRLTCTIEKVHGDIERASGAEEHRRRGELLKAQLHAIRRGMTEVRVVDYTEEGPVERTIALDPARGPKENLEREFRLYRRLSAGQQRARARLEQLQAELSEFDAQLAAADKLSDEELLGQAAPERPALPRKARRAGPALPYRELVSASGQRIRVGRGASENDALTFRHSKGNHVWFHARGVPGAHVVVPLERDEALKDETIQDAALLAAHHSEARGQGLVEVSWTRVKYVRKVKGVVGAVTYSQEKTLAVRADPERLARLLAQLG